ncbi:MAG: VanZ family protein [Oscillospiraceae bacterium]|nr:VanZ family protein [Oscillospiraceae bacterium]
MTRTAAYLFAMLWGAAAALAAFLCLRPWRRRRLRAAGQISPPGRELALALFWMYCGGMAVLTLLPRWVVWTFQDCLHGYGWNAAGYPFFALGAVNLVPFATFGDPYILLGNLVMFLPFGFFPALLFRNFGWRRALAAGFCVTAFIETSQLFVGRAFDIDDLMLNTLGAFCGFLLQRALGRGLCCAPAGK